MELQTPEAVRVVADTALQMERAAQAAPA